MRRAESKWQIAAAKLTRKTNEPKRSQRKALGGAANQIYLGTSIHIDAMRISSDRRVANISNRSMSY